MRDEPRETGRDETQPAIPAPRAETPGARRVPPASAVAPAPDGARESGSDDTTLDDYAVRLAALKAYDITGVRPRDLHDYRRSGTLPDGVPPTVLLRAQRILEEERARLLRLAES